MERLKKYLPLLLFSCKRVSEIISKDNEELTLKEKLILLYHNTICRTCEHFKIQSNILDKTISKSYEVENELQLSEVKKIEIIEGLKKLK